MKRFVTYLFRYQNGKKQKNVGHIRVRVQNGAIQMQINIKDFELGQETGEFYLIIKQEKVFGIFLGKLQISYGQYQGIVSYDGDILPQNIIGVGICFEHGVYMASCWKDEEESIANASFLKNTEKMDSPELIEDKENIDSLKFIENKGNTDSLEFIEDKENIDSLEFIENKGNTDNSEFIKDKENADSLEFIENKETIDIPELIKNKEETEPKDFIEDQMEEQVFVEDREEGSKANLTEIEQLPTKSEEMPLEMQLSDEMIEETTQKVSYRKINLHEIHHLPSHLWHISNNSFLLHGFWNYGYLVLKESVENGEKKLSLGVSGIFEQPEMVMATYFGFPKFEILPLEVEKMEIGETFVNDVPMENQLSNDGVFGCWFMQVD